MCFRITGCCCFRNTKYGSFAVGIYTSILSVFSIILSAILLSQFENIIKNDDKYNKIVYAGLTENAIKTNSIVALVSGVIFLLVSFFLLYGVKKDKRLYLIPWMIWMALVIVGQIVITILLFISMFYNVYFSIPVFIVGLYTAFDIYCYSCVYSQYKALNETIAIGIPLQTTV